MENYDQTIKKIDTLFEGLVSTADVKIYLTFLDKYFDFINKLPEFSKRILTYSSERNKYYDEIKETDKNLSTEVAREVLRISSKESVNPKRIDETILTDWGDQTDDVPRDGKSILEFYRKLEKGSGLSKYLALKEFVEYINSNNEEIYSFACGFDNLSIGEKCQDSYHKWLKKYHELNAEGQIWWSYQQILSEKRKVSSKIDILRLKKFVSALHNDIKQILIIGVDQEEPVNKKIPIPFGVHFEQPEGSKYYILTGLNGKELRFKNKEEDIVTLFLFYFENHGLSMNNEDAYKSVKNPDRKFVNIMTSLKGTIRRQQLRNTVQLEGTTLGSYRLEIKINS